MSWRFRKTFKVLPGVKLEWSPRLRQPVKTQNPFKGELSHGVVTQVVHQGVQAGRGSAAGRGRLDRGGGTGVGSQPERAASLEAGVSPGTRQRLSGKREAALERRPDRGTGTQDRPAGAGDRFFEGVLAAHRGTADAAGLDWKSGVYRKVEA